MQCKLIFFILLTFLLIGCEENSQRVRVPAKELYYGATLAAESEFFTQAQEKLQELINENPGTHLSTLAHLKLAEINYRRGQWDEAETNYRLFLTLNPKHHLVSYVLGRLIALNYERNVQGFFFKGRDYERDMEPNRKILVDHDRFFLLYPKSRYLEEVQDYYLKARSDLAEYQFLVGNFYFEYEIYGSAILRYLSLLKTYPEYPRTQEVGEKLVEAYRYNRQPRLAKETLQVLKERFPETTLR